MMLVLEVGEFLYSADFWIETELFLWSGVKQLCLIEDYLA